MRRYRTSEDFCFGEGEENLLEQVLRDAKPIVSSTVDGKYDIASRPTELSSGGYIDITD